MRELIFVVEEAPDAGSLQDQIKDAVLCHFEEDERPQLVRL